MNNIYISHKKQCSNTLMHLQRSNQSSITAGTKKELATDASESERTAQEDSTATLRLMNVIKATIKVIIHPDPALPHLHKQNRA